MAWTAAAAAASDNNRQMLVVVIASNDDEIASSLQLHQIYDRVKVGLTESIKNRVLLRFNEHTP